MTDTIKAILMTNTGNYGEALAPAAFHVLTGRDDGNGAIMIKGAQFINMGCLELNKEEDNGGWDAEYEYAILPEQYELLAASLEYSNLKLLNDSVYGGADMAGHECQGFHIDAVLGGPEGYCVLGTELHARQEGFTDDDFLYLWAVDDVEVLPVSTATLH